MTTIVVEGCDGSGKTTLIERARENQRDRYFLTVRASRYPPSVKISLQYLQWIKHQRDLDLILDRIHFISDRVYGPILRNEDLFKDFPLNFGLQSVTAVVYARPPTEKILENVNTQSHLRGVREHIEKLIDGYDSLILKLEHQGIKVFRFDYTADEAVSFWRHVWGSTKK